MGVFDGYIEATETLIATYRDNGRTDLDLLYDILKGADEDGDYRQATNQAREMISYLSMRGTGR